MLSCWLTFHADHSLALVDLHPGLAQNVPDDRPNHLAQLHRERLAEHRMRDQPLAAEECLLPDPFRPVDDLVRDDKVAWGDVFPKGTDGRECHNRLDANVLEGGDVGTRGDLGRGDGVGCAVPGDEGDKVAGGQGGDSYRRRRLSPGLNFSAAVYIGAW
jgi:hypothetical protein